MKIFIKSFYFFSFVLVCSCSSVPMIKTQNRGAEQKKTADAVLPSYADTKDSAQDSVLHRSSEVNAKIKAITPSESLLSAEAMDAAVIAPAPSVPVSRRIQPEFQTRQVSDQYFETNNRKIGVILPLTGRNSAISQRALAAIRLGFKIDSSSDFSLALYDSQGNPELAAKGVEKLLQDEKVIAILGGLAAREASAIAQQAEFFQVPFFAFSQKSDLTDDARYTFRNSVTPAMQVSKLVEYAITKLGHKKFAILSPNDAYGIEFANQFWDHVLAYGGTIVGAQVYDAKESDLTSYIQKLVGTYYVENRPEEYRIRMDEIKERKRKQNQAAKAPARKTRESESKENVLTPIVDFDAIFIPDSSVAMGQAIGFFRAADVTQLTYLGTNLWNTEDLPRRAHQVAAGAVNHFYFVDNVISDEQRRRSEFNALFNATYKEQPSIIEVQTFESARILRDLLLTGARDRYSLASRLRELGRRQGAFAEIYMNNSNEVVRDLSVLSLQNGIIVPL